MQRALFVAEHSPHAPVGWHAGVVPPHSPSAAQARQVCVAVLQTGVVPPHWAFDVHGTQVALAVSHTGVAPPHWVAHIRRLGRIQRDTGGFTEFVPLPFVWQNSPIYLAGKARPGPTLEDNRRMHAVARLYERTTGCNDVEGKLVHWAPVGRVGSMKDNRAPRTTGCA